MPMLADGMATPRARPAPKPTGMSRPNALAAIQRATQAAATARRIGAARNNYVSNIARNARTTGKAANVVTRGYIGNVSNSRPRTNQQNYSSSRSSGGGGYSSSSGGGGGYSGGSSSGGGGGGGGGFEASSFAAPAAPPPPVMQDITIPDATEDTDYKRTVADLARALTDFSAQQGLSRKQYDTGFNEARRRMGWNTGKKAFDRSQPGAYGESMYTNENDFGGRGLFWSGLYGKAVGDINQDFADRAKNLETSRQDNLDTQNLALNTFKSNQESLRDVAKQNAISKIMAQLGVQASEVPVGTGSRVIQRQVM